MSLLFSLLMKLDAGQAKTELRAVTQEMQKSKTEATGMGGSTTAATQKLGFFGNASAVVTAKLKAMREALAQVKTAQNASAGSVANLTGQFNDIGMMMAAGQNPLQLAIQQGTQVTQVIGPMGAAGAVKALGAAFMSALNPTNLAIYGIIAGGAMLVQWLGGAKEEVKSLGDEIKDLSSAADAYTKSAQAANIGTAELTKKYGAATGAARTFLRALEDIDRVKAQDQANATAGSVANSFGGFDQTEQFREGYSIGSEADATIFKMRDALSVTEEQARSLAAALEDLGNAQGAQAQAEAAAVLADKLDQATGGYQNMNSAARGLYDQTVAVGESAAQIAAQVGNGNTAVQAMMQAAASLAGYFSRADGAAAGLASSLGAAATNAWNAARGAAAILVQKGMDPRTGKMYTGGRQDPRMFGENAGTTNTFGVENFKMPEIAKGGSGAGRAGGGAKAAREERDAVAELITKLREEQTLLTETDPVKQEVMKYRKQLAGATAVQRKEIEDLIRAEIQLKAVQQAREYASDTAADFLDELIAKGGKASDILRNLAAQFLSMAARSVITGQGWFANLLGISGGLFSSSEPAKPLADGGDPFAAHGMQYGAGGPRADAMNVRLSAGEFVVNAQATARNRSLLERINAGAKVPGFASGGMIGAGRALSAAGGAVQGALNAAFTIVVSGARGNAEIMEMVEQGISTGLEAYDREVLATRVDQIIRNPRER